MHRRIVKVHPYGHSARKTVQHQGLNHSVNAMNGETITFQFPHGVIDLSKLVLPFKYVRLGSGNDLLPRDTETLIDELEVRLGDTVVNKISHHQQLFFIQSTYGQDADWVATNISNQRVWNNRRIIQTLTNMDGWEFVMTHFLGLLGSGAVIDTRKTGKLTVQIRLADNATLTQSNTASTWGVRDMFFRAHYLPDDAPSVDRVLFDDYTAMRMAFPSYDSRVTLVVDGRRKLDYVLARHVPVNLHDVKASSVDNGVRVTNRFRTEAWNVMTWDVFVNGVSPHTFKSIYSEAVSSLRDIWPRGVVNVDTTQSPFPTNFLGKVWAAGVLLDLPQREDGQQHEISFETVGTFPNADQPVYVFLYAKTTSAIDVSSGTLQLIV